MAASLTRGSSERVAYGYQKAMSLTHGLKTRRACKVGFTVTCLTIVWSTSEVSETRASLASSRETVFPIQSEGPAHPIYP
jgi:hypothetical protein